MLIHLLHGIQCLLCGIAKHSVCFPLQSGQIIKFRRADRFLFHIILLHFAHTLHTVRSHFICIFFFLKMLCDRIHLVKLDMSHIIFFFGKFLDLLISIHDHGKCRCLHSSNFQILVIQNGKKTARIDSHQPVCLCPAKC